MWIGDAWSLKDFAWEVQDVKEISGDSDASSLAAQVFWTSPLWTDDRGVRKPLVRETLTIKVHRASRDMRKIDFDIRLDALENGMRIGGAEMLKDTAASVRGLDYRTISNLSAQEVAWSRQYGPLRPGPG